MAIKLIHETAYFTKDEILRRADQYEYPNPLAVEIFLWDCELTAQLQTLSDKIVLKGGAAAQLYLPLERQRGSVDVDLATSLDKKNVEEVIIQLRKTLEGCAGFSQYEPKKPNPNLPLLTYLGSVPSLVDPKRENLEIKLDFLCESPDLPHIELHNVQTFALKVKRVICSTTGALIGDKLLTLAKGSIGTELAADLPKQIYDVDALFETCTISTELIDDMIMSINELTKLEASFRRIKVTPIEALSDVCKAMSTYSLVDTPSADAPYKKEIERFQQFFVSRSQRKPYYEWSSKCLRIRFLAILAQKLLSREMEAVDVAGIIRECKEMEASLRKISGDSVGDLRDKMLKLAQTRMLHYKDLRGKSLERVFWQVLTLENLRNMKLLI
jgi:hypothetical protein